MSAGSNSFGRLFRWTTFGESHGPAMGVVIDGCPAGLEFNKDILMQRLATRRPGQAGTTGRVESDEPEILSGVFAGQTLGTPIAIVVKNIGQKSTDYNAIKNSPRVGHADDVWEKKFGHRDHRGGGRASARETLNWVIAGSVAEMFCRETQNNMEVNATLIEVGGETFSNPNDPLLLKKLEKAKAEGESYGAIVGLHVANPPAFVGEPVFQKTKSELSHAFMGINACCGVELGDGFSLAGKVGTEVHQEHQSRKYGGVRGGITTGENLSFRLAFKPTSSILDIAKRGRHDPCVALRALPIVEAMTWNVMADLILAQRLNRMS